MSTSTLEDCGKGSEVTLYYNVGTAGTPVWVEHVGIIGDISMPETEELQEITGRRVTRNVKEYNEGEIELSITGEQLHAPNYEGWQFLNSMRRGGISREVMCLSNKITVSGAYGWRGDFRNSDRSLQGPASGNKTNTFNLQPAGQCHTGWSEPRVVKVQDNTDTATTGDVAVLDFDPTVYEVAS